VTKDDIAQQTLMRLGVSLAALTACGALAYFTVVSDMAIRRPLAVVTLISQGASMTLLLAANRQPKPD
jgi:hypothetical protein